MNWIFTLKIFIDMNFNLLRTKLLRSTPRWCRDHAVNGRSTDWWPNRTPAAALHSKKKTNSVASHQSLLSVSQIVLLHIIFHNDKSSEQKVHSMKRWVEQLERGRWVNLTKASRHLQQCCLQLTCIWFNLHHTWGLLMKCETFVWCITLAESCLPTCSRSWQWGLRFSTFSSSSW